MCGSATSSEDVAKLCNEPIECAFTSPPYNKGTNALGGNKAMTDSKYLDYSDDLADDDYLDLLSKSTANALQVSNCVAVNLQMLASNKRVILRWLGEFSKPFIDRMVWFKGQGCPAIKQNVMNSRFEDVWFFTSKVDKPSRTIITGNFAHTVSNVYEGRGADSDGDHNDASQHAARMPKHFAVHVVSVMAGSRDSVYDCFAGTGTTMAAAVHLGMKSYSMELCPQYCDIIVDRFRLLSNEKVVRIEAQAQIET